MKKFLFSIILLTLFFFSSAQENIDDKTWARWDSAVLSKANTGANADYLSPEEKMVLLITNLARLDGPLFSETFLDNFLQGEEKNKYSKSLYKDLKSVKGLQPLNPEMDLYSAASGHALKSGKNGQVGHQGFDARFKPLMKKYNSVAENCAYGYEKGIDNAIQLLIDKDVPSLGHRTNMLNPEYNSVGVSIKPHKTYKYNCVMDFGRKN